MTTSISIQTAASGGISLHDLALGSAYLGAAVGVAMVIPQIVRTFGDRSRPGVSALSWALTALSSLTWLLYGLRTDEAPQIPGNVLIVAGSALVVLAVPAAISGWARAGGLLAAAVTVAALALVVPAAVVGSIGFAFGLVAGLPQTVSSLRRSRDSASSAVSIPAWLLRAFSQVLWLFYGIVLHDSVLIVSATLILASALVLVAAERRRVPAPVDAHDLAPVAACATS